VTPVLQFRVTGLPAAQGSKRHVGNGIMVESSKAVKPWRQDVVAAAQAATEGTDWEAPAHAKAILVFYFRRPRSHYRTGRFSDQLRPDAPAYHSTKPDADKLARSTFDALTTAAVIKDDCTVVDFRAQKRYAADNEPAGALILLTTANNELPDGG
jgi:crossover junction endodeoxyribonuclease RusA